MNITSNRTYSSDLREPIEIFCRDAGIDSLRWIEAGADLRIEAETTDYRYIVQAIDVIEATSIDLNRAARRYELMEERLARAEADKLKAIKRRRERADHKKATAAIRFLRPSSRRKRPTGQ